jgi:hypothetical protein
VVVVLIARCHCRYCYKAECRTLIFAQSNTTAIYPQNRICKVAANDCWGVPFVPPMSLLMNMLQGAISSVVPPVEVVELEFAGW